LRKGKEKAIEIKSLRKAHDQTETSESERTLLVLAEIAEGSGGVALLKILVMMDEKRGC
jgi:hypothetical protein